jgi:hypothetical protein
MHRVPIGFDGVTKRMCANSATSVGVPSAVMMMTWRWRPAVYRSQVCVRRICDCRVLLLLLF